MRYIILVFLVGCAYNTDTPSYPFFERNVSSSLFALEYDSIKAITYTPVSLEAIHFRVTTKEEINENCHETYVCAAVAIRRLWGDGTEKFAILFKNIPENRCIPSPGLGIPWAKLMIHEILHTQGYHHKNREQKEEMDKAVNDSFEYYKERYCE